MRTSRRPIAIMRRSCSDSLLTASQSDGVFGSDTRYPSQTNPRLTRAKVPGAPSQAARPCMKDIAEWLASLDLAEYAQRFAENGIDLSVIRDLTENDLKELGVLLGHRRKMLRAIAELQRAPARKLQTAEPARRDRAERRQLTVMFCDLVGSTALSARLDPEDMRQMMALYHRRIAEVIGSHQGIVARYMGDRVLVYFGYPQAHEDDAEQAGGAGLALVEAVPNLQPGGDAPLQVRVGIATGVAVVGDLIG